MEDLRGAGREGGEEEEGERGLSAIRYMYSLSLITPPAFPSQLNSHPLLPSSTCSRREKDRTPHEISLSPSSSAQLA